jgi:hypothetical protein
MQCGPGQSLSLAKQLTWFFLVINLFLHEAAQREGQIETRITTRIAKDKNSYELKLAHLITLQTHRFWDLYFSLVLPSFSMIL